MRTLEIRGNLQSVHDDVLTPEVVSALHELAPLDDDRKEVMANRIGRRTARARKRHRIEFLDSDSYIPRTLIKVQDARDGAFVGSEIPADLQRQWIQGTGPAARPGGPAEAGLRNIAYALLSGADGWMFDGEDALGQVSTMSLDNQRNLKLAIRRDPVFLAVAEQVAAEMNQWAQGFFGRPIVGDWKTQLDFTTKIFRPRGLHLDDRHIRHGDGASFSASIVDTTLFIVNNHEPLRHAGASLVLYLPKIQTAEEAALWNEILTALETHLGLDGGTIKVYVLVEQLEAAFQLMEIRAALGKHFIGFNTGRWDYINSVSDAMAWDPHFINPNIDTITMTYGYMHVYEDRVRRACSTPDQLGQRALWQGGMEPNIPVGSTAGVDASMKRALAGAEREQREGANGKWVAHWKMVQIVRPVWENIGEANQLARDFPPLTYTHEDADGLTLLEPAARTIRGARDLLSVALQYGNAFGQGLAGGRTQTGRLLRQRRRAVSDGRHGDRRDPAQHPLGMAAQARDADRRRRDRRQRRRRVHDGAVRALADGGVREAAAREQPRRPRQLEDHHAADRQGDRRDLRARRREAAVVHRPPEHQSRSPRRHGSETPHRSPHRGVSQRRHTAHGESRLRRN